MNTDALTIGPATILVATSGSTLDADDLTDLAAGNTPAGWTSIGQTTEAVTITDAPTYVEARSQQAARALAMAVSELKTSIGTTLRETDLRLLEDVTRGTSSTVSGISTVDPSGLGVTPTFAVAVFGPWPGGNLLLAAPRATFTGEREVAFSSADFTAIAVEIEILETSATGFEGGYKIFAGAETLGS